jgi:hypothetical protein
MLQISMPFILYWLNYYPVQRKLTLWAGCILCFVSALGGAFATTVSLLLGVAAMNNADRRATADPTNHLPRASLRRWCRHAIRTNHQLHVRVVRQEKEPCLRYHVRRVTTTFHTTANIFEVVEWVVFSARFCLRSSLSA